MAHKIESAFVLIIIQMITVCGFSQGVEDANIRLSFAEQYDSYTIGDEVNLKLDLSYQSLPAGSRIYVHLMPLRDNRWVTYKEGTLSGEDFKFSFEGSIQDGDKSVFNIDKSNFPVTHTLDHEMLRHLFKSFGIGEGNVEKFVNSVSTSDEGYDLSLAFLASNGNRNSGFEQTDLSFEIPDYPHCFNGVAIAPFIFYYKEDTPVLFTKTENMPGLRLDVQPLQPCEPVEQNKKPEVSFNGSLELTEFYPSDVTLYTGMPNTIELEFEYSDLPDNSLVYVAFLPSVTKDKYLFGSNVLTLPNYSGSLVPDFFDNASAIFAIPKDDMPLKIPFYADQILEAGMLTKVDDGAQGSGKGTVTFTPPAYANRYRRVYLMPLVVSQNNSGTEMRAHIDKERIEGIYLNVSEN